MNTTDPRACIVAVLAATIGVSGCTGAKTNATTDDVVHWVVPRPPSYWVERLRATKDPDIRRQAYLELAQPKHYEDSPELMDTVMALYALALQSEKEVYVRAAVAGCLGRFRRPEALSALRCGTADTANAVRVDACTAVGDVCQPGGDDLLAGVLQDDPEPDVRLSAAEALAHYPTRRSVQELIRALGDKDIAVQRRARLSLKSITDEDLGQQPTPWHRHLQSHLDAYPEDLTQALAAQRARHTAPAPKWHYLYLF